MTLENSFVLKITDFGLTTESGKEPNLRTSSLRRWYHHFFYIEITI